MPGWKKRRSPDVDGDGLRRRRSSRSGRGKKKDGDHDRLPSSPPTRPPPTPAPPHALVRLLQSDPQVLAYFQSLRANLQADVAIWKHRASVWKEENEELKASQSRETGKNKSNGFKSNSKSKSKRKVDSRGGIEGAEVAPAEKRQKDTPLLLQTKTKPPETPRRGHERYEVKNKDDEEEGEAVSDSMFELESLPSDVEGNEGEPNPTARTSTTTTPATAVGGEAVEGIASHHLFSIESCSSSSSDGADNNSKSKEAVDGQRDNGSGEKRWNVPAVETDPDGGQAIADDMFELESNSSSSSSSSDDEEDKFSFVPEASGTPMPPALDGIDCHTSRSPEGMAPIFPDREITFGLLREAYRALQRLGIPVVDLQEEVHEEPITAEYGSSRIQGSGSCRSPAAVLREEAEDKEAPVATTVSEPPPPRRSRVVRRPDEQVASDFFLAIRSLVRVQLGDKELAEKYPPFNARQLKPCCRGHSPGSTSAPKEAPANGTEPQEEQQHQEQRQEQKREQQQQQQQEQEQEQQRLLGMQPPHPSIEGKQLAFRALVILDTFCDRSVPIDQWNNFFVRIGFHDYEEDEGEGGSDDPDSTERESICVGLRDRKTLVEHLLQSLEGEISESWPHGDRSANATTPALHFYGTTDTPIDLEEEEKEVVAARDPCREGGEVPGALTGGAKSQARLTTLVERCLLGEMAIALYLSRNDPQTAVHLVLDYILSSVPALSVEDHPRLPPVLSFVVLEAMLRPEHQSSSSGDSWFFSHLSAMTTELMGPASGNEDPPSRQTITTTVENALSLCLHSTASFWKRRLDSPDDRIRDLARVEWAAYERIRSSEGPWLRMEGYDSPERPLDALMSGRVGVDRYLLASDCLALELLLILRGEVQCMDRLFDEALDRYKSDRERGPSFGTVARVAARASRQVEIRRLEFRRQLIGSKSPPVRDEEDDDGGEGGTSPARFYEAIAETARDWSSPEDQRILFGTALTCAGILADGWTSCRIVDDILERHGELLVRKGGVASCEYDDGTGLLDAIISVGEMPLVRVVNLKRRADRLNAFMSQSLKEGLLVVQAVVNLRSGTVPEECPEEYYFFGNHAFDGSGRMPEAHERLSLHAGSTANLDALVETHWRPVLLKPYDRDARDDDALVRISSSERACALSHISSWNGVLRSLKLPPLPLWCSAADDGEGEESPTNRFLRYRDHLKRRFRITGFAEGPALLTRNADMPPSPVCVVLEDDCILVDRFVDRLRAVLKELPRDFHFCSLGYSRPRSAPIVPFGSHVGVPTFQWYLTGYVLSQAGAEHLCESLPVSGPVDSWIGLKMADNWDNHFGEFLGVGTHGRGCYAPSSEATVPPLRDLRQILRFRAFCAMHPLCSQRVGGSPMSEPSGPVSSSPAGGRAWRQRDTDIEYSGDATGCGGGGD